MKEEYKYCWLNTITGEFSNTWNEEEHQKYNPLNINGHINTEWKLIKFQCLTDESFEFTKYMKLK